MKKIVSMLAAFAMAAALLVSCSNGSSTPKSDVPGDNTPAELVVFEGEEILEADGYGNYVTFETPIAKGSGYKTFEVTYSWTSDDGIQCNAQLMNGDTQASATVSSGSKAAATVKGACLAGATFTNWDKGGVDDACADEANQLQIYIQNASYAATKGTITVTKIVLKK